MSSSKGRKKGLYHQNMGEATGGTADILEENWAVETSH